jgi:hypothetical protein
MSRIASMAALESASLVSLVLVAACGGTSSTDSLPRSDAEVAQESGGQAPPPSELTGGASGNAGGGGAAGGATGGANVQPDASVDAPDDVVVDSPIDSAVPDADAGCYLPPGPQDSGPYLTGLVARYCFNDPLNLGTDCSGNAYPLNAALGSSFVATGFSGAALLDGVRGYLQGTPSAAFTPGAGSFTVSAWIRPKGARDATIVSWYRCGAYASCPGSSLYGLSVTVDGGVKWSVRSDGDVNPIVTSPGGVVDDACWHLVTGVMSTVDATRLFVDGAEVGTALPPVSPLSASLPVPLSVGRNYITGWAVPDAYYAGEIDDVRVYSRALSRAEIRTMYTGKP